jgi:hypothetical protein
MACMRSIWEVRSAINGLSLKNIIVYMAFFLSFLILFLRGSAYFNQSFEGALNDLFAAIQSGASIYPSVIDASIALVIWFIVFFVIYIFTHSVLWFSLKNKISFSQSLVLSSLLISLIVSVVYIILISDVPYVEITSFLVLLVVMFTLCIVCYTIYDQRKKYLVFLKPFILKVLLWEAIFFVFQLLLFGFSIIFLFLAKVSPFETPLGIFMDILLFLAYVFVFIGSIGSIVSISSKKQKIRYAIFKKKSTYVYMVLLVVYITALGAISWVLRLLPGGNYLNFIFWFIFLPFGIAILYNLLHNKEVSKK